MRSFSPLDATMAIVVLAALLLVSSTARAASERVTDLLLERSDTDHNQLISEGEYHAAMQHRFEQLDSNKDGNLTRQEMEQARANTRGRLQGLRGGRVAN